jgi:ribosomal protein S18 acetylase RimI-like enzyme
VSDVAAVRVRRVTDDEWPRLRELRLRALADAPDAFGSTLDVERAYGEAEWSPWIRGWPGWENAVFVAVLEDRWVAMVVGARRPDDPTAHLFAMWVEPGTRRGGIGVRLVEAVLGWAAEHGATSVELGVTETNADARAFYQRCGFVETGRREPLREGSPLDLLVLVRAPIG